jgi:tetratricopeptide (TPR) repeat protein
MDYFDLGTYSRAVTTSSQTAQLWFDRGLVWIFAYNHEEAIVCFEKAIEADPDCAMAHWGIAYAIGPNYNKPWDDFEADEKPEALSQALAEVARATGLKDQVTPVERALIEALAHRYPENPEIEDFGPWNDTYADAMRDVHKAHRNDLDVCTLFAEAIMNRTPWQLWDLPSGQPAVGADTAEAIVVLETAFDNLAGAWEHPGLLHMYIHLMEMSPHPERALRQGDRLSTLVPDAGHLLHMATHIDVLCGEYQDVVARNSTAIIADRKFLAHAGAENFYSVYRCHNYHFKIYGAMFLGQPAAALSAADELIETLPEATLRPMADWFEAFIPMKQHVLIRFGRWQDILDQVLPDDQELFSVTTAMMHYARTVALANTGDPAGAESECGLFYAARDRVQESRMLFNNTCLDILKIAEQMMLGELEYHKGNHGDAFAHLRASVDMDDNLPYDEPWGWMQPTRHALGALLLEQGEYEEAETVYRADLGLDATLSRACQHPGNVWSLHGLHECLTHRGETAEVGHIKLLLDKAVARADVPIEASCFCRHKAAAA